MIDLVGELRASIKAWWKAHRPTWTRGPWVTSIAHGLVTLGAGVGVWQWTGSELLGAITSTVVAVWYTRREGRQHDWTRTRFADEGFRMFLNKPKRVANETWTGTSRRPPGEVELTWSQKVDPIADLVFPYAAAIGMWVQVF